MSKVIMLDKWGMAANDNPYQPPEMRTWSFKGEVYGHPRFKDKHYVRTSVPVACSVDEMMVQTASGSVYLLGEPDPEYLKVDPGLEKTMKYLRQLQSMEQDPEETLQQQDDEENN